MEILISERGRFEHYSYSSEAELEDFVASTSKELFGQGTIFVSFKKRIGLGKGQLSIPDGYVIDLSDVENPTLFIIEVELAQHDVYKHIYPQITQHLNFFDKNKEKVKDDLEMAIGNEKGKKQFIESKIKGSNYSSLSDLIYELVFIRPKSLVVVIDKISEELREVMEKNISKFSDTKVIQFDTYASIEKNKKAFIHKFTPAYEEELGELSEEPGTWYKLYLEDVQPVNEGRTTFDPKHNVSKFAQGFVYSKNRKNEIDGVVVLWYKSNIDEYFIKAQRDYVSTGRSFNINKLSVGMEVFLVELQYDREVNRRIEDPKARIRGKLRSVMKVDGDTETKIFPP